jgi:hypothetical protein
MIIAVIWLFGGVITLLNMGKLISKDKIDSQDNDVLILNLCIFWFIVWPIFFVRKIVRKSKSSQSHHKPDILDF